MIEPDYYPLDHAAIKLGCLKEDLITLAAEDRLSLLISCGLTAWRCVARPHAEPTLCDTPTMCKIPPWIITEAQKWNGDTPLKTTTLLDATDPEIFYDFSNIPSGVYPPEFSFDGVIPLEELTWFISKEDVARLSAKEPLQTTDTANNGASNIEGNIKGNKAAVTSYENSINFWTKWASVPLDLAVELVIGNNPEDDDRFKKEGVRSQFTMLKALAMVHATTYPEAKFIAKSNSDKWRDDPVVFLPEFGAWAESKGYVLPEHFPVNKEQVLIPSNKSEDGNIAKPQTEKAGKNDTGKQYEQYKASLDKLKDTGINLKVLKVEDIFNQVKLTNKTLWNIKIGTFRRDVWNKYSAENGLKKQSGRPRNK
jgi:hypothetical protein